MKDYNIKDIEDVIKEKCGEYILLHTERTRDIAFLLREIYGGDEEIINLSILLHDIAINEDFKVHAEKGSEIVRGMFKGKWDDSLLEKVCYCIKYHSITSQKPEKITPELVCVYDADKIDFLLDVGSRNPLYNVVSRSFLGKKSYFFYEKLRRIMKWYKK